jgi:hypothetical protein
LLAVGGRYDWLMEQAWDKAYVSCTWCPLRAKGDTLIASILMKNYMQMAHDLSFLTVQRPLSDAAYCPIFFFEN